MVEIYLTEVLLNGSLRASNELQYAYIMVVLKYLDSDLDVAYDYAASRDVNHMLAYSLLNNLIHKELTFPHTIEEAIVKDRVNI